MSLCSPHCRSSYVGHFLGPNHAFEISNLHHVPEIMIVVIIILGIEECVFATLFRDGLLIVILHT